MKANTIELLVTDLLAACDDAYTNVDYAPDRPERMYASHGTTTTWEGEQLTITCVAVKPVSPFPLPKQSAVKSALVPAADLTIEVLRAGWPSPEASAAGSRLPETDAIHEASILVASDATTLFSWVSMLAAKGGLFPSIPEIGRAEEIGLGSMLPLGPQGGLAGWRWTVNVKLAIL